ncbi:hypothetical protein CJF31_00000718 [Rutstroemia sp. NJR-2017a BVV2]|nr:hypothetical protein CJF31_00000718 [Rutstroemia sp. NJR-2017a BVV2]
MKVVASKLHPTNVVMMEPVSPVVFRRKTLTNSAAEFVERRAGKEVLLQLEDSSEDFKDLKDVSEFVTELDRFALKGVVFDATKYYDQSKTSMLKFRGTLQSFVTVLKERNVDSQLNIVLKDPSELTVEYIIQIINRLGERNENPSKTKSCKNFIQSCHRKYEDNKGIVEGILTMIPNDIYGSVISGGFTVILAAVEKQAKQREAIQNWLAEIPEKLETIQRLSEIHHASIRLHSCANDIIVAIFTVLERIVDKITRTWKVKLGEQTGKITKTLHSLPFRSKPGADAAVDEDEQEKKLTVPDALAQLQKRIDSFQKEVDMCERERLGEVAKNTANIESGLVFIANQNVALKKTIDTSMKRLEDMFSGIPEKPRQMLHLYLEDALYRFCASNPNFDARTGEIDRAEVKLLEQEREVTSMRSRQEGNSRIASKWLPKPKLYDPIGDMKDCLGHIALLDSDEKNISRWMLSSEEHTDWLQGTESSILEVQLQTPPASLNNPLSFTSALIATTLRSTAQFPVLAFFCMHRNNESYSEEKSGPTALVRSLNSQLLKFIADKRPSVDLSPLENRDLFSRAKKTLKDGLRLLDALFSSLPEDDMVFVIIDSLSRLSGSMEDAEKVVKKLKRIIEKRDDLVIKMVVTDALAGSYINSVADISLYVPDVVSGYGGFSDL